MENQDLLFTDVLKEEVVSFLLNNDLSVEEFFLVNEDKEFYDIQEISNYINGGV